MKTTRVTALLLLSAAFLAFVAPVLQAQTNQGLAQGVSQQQLVSHADVSIAGTASPTPTALATPNVKTVYWLCQNTGGTNTARVGDVNITGSRGILLPVCTTNNCLPVAIPMNGTLYGFSSAGTTVGCQEIDLQ